MTNFGEYECVKKLGAGGQATTWLATRSGSTEEVLIKVLHVEAAENWKLVELFERTARVLESIEHPRIPAYRDHFEIIEGESARLCLVREFVGGESLQDRIEDGGSLSENEVIALAIQILEILVYLHSREPVIVHRDIKPANLIVNEDMELYLVDFGAVQAEVMRETGGSTVVGTAGYVAPEQLMGRAQPASDIYALGVTLAHLLTRKPPIEFASNGFELDITGELHASPALVYIIGRMTRADIDEREDSAEHLLETFRTLDAGGEIVVRSSTLPTTLPTGSNLEVIDTGDTVRVNVPKSVKRFLFAAGTRSKLIIHGITVVPVLIYFCFFAPAVGLGGGFLVLLVLLGLYRAWTPPSIELHEESLELTTFPAHHSWEGVEDLGQPILLLNPKKKRITYDSLKDVVFMRTLSDKRLMVLRTQSGVALIPESHPELPGATEPGHYGLDFLISQGEEIWLAKLLNSRLAQHREKKGR